MFEFHLRPLPEVIPWGKEPDLNLSWFGLTDGYYQINLEKTQLYLSSEDYAKAHPDEALNEFQKKYVDYHVVRLYEDLLDVLPYALQPLPQKLTDIVLDPEGEKQLIAAYFHNEELWSDELYEKTELATNWFGRRILSAMHLKQGPCANFFRIKDEILIRWDRGEAIHAASSFWEPGKGDCWITVDKFFEEVKYFHQSLIEQMQSRVEDLIRDNPLPHVNIDLVLLQEEQHERSLSLESALKVSQQLPGWSEVLKANRDLFPEFF